jgi:hypothetical protein
VCRCPAAAIAAPSPGTRRKRKKKKKPQPRADWEEARALQCQCRLLFVPLPRITRSPFCRYSAMCRSQCDDGFGFRPRLRLGDQTADISTLCYPIYALLHPLLILCCFHCIHHALLIILINVHITV